MMILHIESLALSVSASCVCVVLLISADLLTHTESLTLSECRYWTQIVKNRWENVHIIWVHWGIVPISKAIKFFRKQLFLSCMESKDHYIRQFDQYSLLNNTFVRISPLECHISNVMSSANIRLNLVLTSDICLLRVLNWVYFAKVYAYFSIHK